MQLQYKPLEIEPAMLKFWKENKIYEKLQERNANGSGFYFLDGPPYTSGKVHLGTAMNKTLKDAMLRYKRMKGFNVWDKAGYDMHGLPIEHAVEKKLGMKGKEDILKMGIGTFNKECRTLSTTNLTIMNELFKKLGVWMDFDNAYQTIKPEFIEGEWLLVKKAHDQGRLYEGLRTMSWCASCATANAKHECEYQNITDNSIFVKFPVVGKENTYLVIWTTTPWTIPFNLAIMVNPELEYQLCDVEGEKWVVAKALAGVFLSSVAGKKFEVIDEFLGDKLKGWEYTHPFADTISDYKKLKEKSSKVHSVLLSTEYVDTSAGTGLVHCAPGCGPEDYEVGHENGIPPYNTIDIHGQFPDTMGEFSGLYAKKDDKKFVEGLDKRGVLIASTPVEHDYAHCWRCHNPVVFRTTKQWFFKIEDLKDKMIKENENIQWVPKQGFNAFDSWLKNLRDNSITKQRFWGCPLPVWRCKSCEEYDVIGSRQELESKGCAVPPDLHKPGIDEVKYKCKCGGEKARLPDVLDVWVDAGTVSWSCLDYPQRQDLFDKWFPADFILEGIDQYRGWFNLLVVASTLAFDKLPFKNVYVHGFIDDSQGRKMSKSLGNVILPEEITSVYGADTFRYAFIGDSSPAVNLCYNEGDIKVRFRNIGVLWNLHKFLIDHCKNNSIKPTTQDCQGFEERYILSRMNSSIKECTKAYDRYLINEVPDIAESLYLDLSRTYIQLVRDKASLGSTDDKKEVAYVVHTVLMTTLKMLAPTIPFVTEQIYQNLREVDLGTKEESVHHLNWPESDANQINTELEADMQAMQGVIQGILFAREKAQLGIRWPVGEIIVQTPKEEIANAVTKLSKLICGQTNVKNIKVKDKVEGVVLNMKPILGRLGAEYAEAGQKLAKAIEKMNAQEVLNSIQEKGVYTIEMDNCKYDLTHNHVIFSRDCPDNLVEAEAKGAIIFLDKTRTDELDSEGYAREIMRRVQSLRKNVGLQKTDKVELHIGLEEDLEKMLIPWTKQIAEKCGSDTVTFGKPGTAEHSSVEKVKGKEILISFV